MDPSPPTHTAQTKTLLRQRLREERRAHVAALPQGVMKLMFLRPPSPVATMLPEGATVGLYRPIGAEAPTIGYANWLHERGHALALPWFAERDAPMVFRRWADPYADSAMERGPYGMEQPSAEAEALVPDVLFVPMLGFTARGDRLGQGGGHYDRWLEAHPETIAIGLAWDSQLLDSIPTEPHDFKLRAVVTPTRLYEDNA